jgi:hypothetical protein
MTVRHFFEISEDDHPRTVSHTRDHWWTLDFANAFVFLGVNSRGELVPSPRAYARNGARRRWLGDNDHSNFLIHNSRIHIRDGKRVLDGKLVCENPSEYEFRDG